MSARELKLLSPYRLPTQSALYLGDDDVSAFLNGYAALWHPSALAAATGPPRPASPYDHEQPTAGQVYAVPEGPQLLLPDDWDGRVKAAGAVAFRATPDRSETLNHLRDALRTGPHTPREAAALLDLDGDCLAPLAGVGLGLLQLEALFEAMSHDNLLATAELWEQVRQAVAALLGSDVDSFRRHLTAAAELLLTAREALYAGSALVVDLCLLEEIGMGGDWHTAPDRGMPLNVLAAADLLERMAREQPARLAALRERAAAELIEVCGGPYREAEDALLPLESQLWNLQKGQAVYRELLGREVRVYGRRRFAAHPQLPQLLQSAGIGRALLLAFDDAVLPAARASVASWASPDGKQVECFARTPLPAESPQTYFHLAHHIHRSISQDGTPTLALLHRGKPAHPAYADWLALTQLAPAFGRWVTLSTYLDTVSAGDYLAPESGDDFQTDYLLERVALDDVPGPQTTKRAAVSWFAAHARERRRLDTAWTLSALLRALGNSPEADGRSPGDSLSALEDGLESGKSIRADDLEAPLEGVAAALARRLVARGDVGRPGFLVLNPCSFKRRVAVELPGVEGPLTPGGPLRACQVESDKARAVIEVPALGFAWVPNEIGPTPAAGRMRLADDRHVRNEFFEAEIDPATGGLKGIRDSRTRINRLGQQLVFNPGSTMRANLVRFVSAGPALGELFTEGTLEDIHGATLATFRQRFRAWAGRPLLELRVELFPVRPPEGYPWHAYYAARFAWRDDRATLARGLLGGSSVTGHTRPESPDYVEVRSGAQTTVLFPGGLPFHQRHGGRMLDILLVPPGEDEHAFDLGIGLDRGFPAQTALGMVSPAPVVVTTQGPPHVGATGWLFHLDAPNLLLTSLRPASDGDDAVVARLIESSGNRGAAELRCVRNPRRAAVIDLQGNRLMELPIEGDTVFLDVGPRDFLQIRVDFS